MYFFFKERIKIFYIILAQIHFMNFPQNYMTF